MRLNSVYILLLIMCFSFKTKSQAVCNHTETPVEIFPANTITTPTANIGLQLLCGPNTVVYDTIFNGGCRYVYMENNTSLILKAGCWGAHLIVMKNTSTLTVLPGTSSFVYVTMEPSATINNLASPIVTITATQCNSISYLNANCVTLLAQENEENKSSKVICYPIPSTGSFFISTEEEMQLEIVDELGEVVKSIMLEQNNTKQAVSNLNAGIYFIRNKQNGIVLHKRIVVVR